MKVIKLIPLVMLCLFFTNSANAQKKKSKSKTPFLIEYAKITKRNNNTKNTIVIYFEDYGKKFREEYYDSDQKLFQVTAYDGDSLRSISVRNDKGLINLGVIRNPYFMSGREVAIKQEDKKYEVLDNITIAGKDCKQLKYHNSVINKDVIIASWNGIIMSDNLQSSTVISIETTNKPDNIVYKITAIDE